MRSRKRPRGLRGYPPTVKVTRFRTSPAARARNRALYRRQRQKDPSRIYPLALPDSAIADLYRTLGTDVLDRRSVIRELEAFTTRALHLAPTAVVPGAQPRPAQHLRLVKK